MITTQGVPQTMIEKNNPNYTVARVDQEFYKTLSSRLQGIIFHKEVEGEFFVKFGKTGGSYIIKLAYSLILAKVEQAGVEIAPSKYANIINEDISGGENFDAIANKIIELEKGAA
jgi:hypothetical protein